MLHFFWGSWELTSSSRLNKDVQLWIPPSPPALQRMANKIVTEDSSKLFSNLCLKKMTPNAVIMVMPRGSVRSGLCFAKCYVKYQMVPILKSLLSWETRRTKGWVEGVELHLSADKAVLITMVLSEGLWSIPHSAAASSDPPQATIIILGELECLCLSVRRWQQHCPSSRRRFED